MGYTGYMEKICVGPECSKPSRARGMCPAHYGQWRRGKELTVNNNVITPRRSPEEAGRRDDSGNKLCVKCSLWKPEEAYSKNSSTPDGLFSSCKSCVRDRRSMRKYGVTKQAILEEQGGVCAICGSEDVQGKRGHIDHDHKCCPGVNTCGNCVRGVICVSCNHGLGHFSDNPESLRAAALYLERFHQRGTLLTHAW